MWYTLPDSTKQYPLTIERVRKIKSLNHQGVIPEELETVEVTTGKPKEVEPEFVDVVGQISLRSLEKADRKKKQMNERGNDRSNDRGNDRGGDRRGRDQQRPNNPRGGQQPNSGGPGGGGPRNNQRPPVKPKK